MGTWKTPKSPGLREQEFYAILVFLIILAWWVFG